jgi:hypothetical protein
MNFPPPARRRGNKNANSDQEFGPVANVIASMIGVSQRRCATFADMSEKLAQSLVNLQMDCQRMAGYIRSDPQGLNRLGIWLNAARVALEKDKEHLDEQIQIELFLQGELERWLNGEPPSDFAPPPPGMRRQMPHLERGAPQQVPQYDRYPQYPADALRTRRGEGMPQYPPVQGRAPMRSPEHLLPPQFREQAPASMTPQQQIRPQSQSQPQQRPQFKSGPSEPLLSPAAAFAAYQPAQSSQPPQRMPVVRLPVEQYAPAASHDDADEAASQIHQANDALRRASTRFATLEGGRSSEEENGTRRGNPSVLPVREAEEDDKGTTSPS